MESDLLALESAVRRWRRDLPCCLLPDEERIVSAHERLSRVSSRPGRGRRG